MIGVAISDSERDPLMPDTSLIEVRVCLPPDPMIQQLAAVQSKFGRSIAELEAENLALKEKLAKAEELIGNHRGFQSSCSYCQYVGPVFAVQLAACDDMAKHTAICSKSPCRLLEAENKELKEYVAWSKTVSSKLSVELTEAKRRIKQLENDLGSLNVELRSWRDS